MRTIIPLLTLALAALIAPARAQTPAAPTAPMFPFVIPWDDATSGTATDVSFLNAKPAGRNGRIVAKNGHFVQSANSQRIRFLGVNFAAGAAFPSHADAEKVAKRLAKLGINIVRMHHMDNITWGAGQNIWDPAYKDHQHIDPAQLDKLDYLIYQLKQNGVYTNINLHVSRQFTPDDGFPASVNDIKTSFDKRVDEYDRRMIQLQKNYAHDLLTHVNPYTKLSPAADPAVAVVEINNENSLVGDPWATLGAGLSDLPNPFRSELVGFWNDWLTKEYRTNTALQAAWLHGTTPSGPSIRSVFTPWTIEHQGTSDATLTPGIIAEAGGTLTGPDAQINVTTIDATDWHVQAHVTGLDFKNDTTYTVSFRAKSDKPRPLPLGASLDQDDWHNVGLTATAALTTDWQTFHYTFDAHDVLPQHGRIAFTLGGQTGTVWISNLSVKPGAEGAGLQKGESLASKNVAMPETATKAQRADWIAFLADTERAYAKEMRAYLKNDLHVQANVICSQMGYGGLTSLGREADMDFADNHAYWQHPGFPHKPWDSTDWNIPNTSMVADLANGGAGTLRDLAEFRVAGKPYTVSEYNHPAPNDYQSEMMPVIATFAAFQDWDIIYLFDYGSYGATAANDKIQGYFANGSNPAKMAFLPAAAMIFRAGEFSPSESVSSVVLHATDVHGAGTASAAWRAAKGIEASMDDPTDSRPLAAVMRNGPDPAFLQTRLNLGYAGGAGLTGSPFPKHMGGAHNRSQLSVSKASSGGLYVANEATTNMRVTNLPDEPSPSAKVVSAVGYVGGQTLMLGPTAMTFPQFGNNFAAVTLTAMDGQPLNKSKRMLLTMAGKVENEGMVWNATRTSVGDQWGHGPTVAEGIPASVTFTTPVSHVYTLDGTGRRAGEVPVTNPVGGPVTSQLTVGPQYKTLWYEITRE